MVSPKTDSNDPVSERHSFEKRLRGNLIFSLLMTVGSLWLVWYGIFCAVYSVEKHVMMYFMPGAGCFSVGLALGGFAVFSIRSRLRLIQDYNERAILRFASAQMGKPLNRLEIAGQSNLTLAETEKQLRLLEVAGVCQSHADERGEIRYTFPCSAPQSPNLLAQQPESPVVVSIPALESRDG